MGFRLGRPLENHVVGRPPGPAVVQALLKAAPAAAVIRGGGHRVLPLDMVSRCSDPDSLALLLQRTLPSLLLFDLFRPYCLVRVLSEGQSSAALLLLSGVPGLAAAALAEGKPLLHAATYVGPRRRLQR